MSGLNVERVHTTYVLMKIGGKKNKEELNYAV